MLKKQNEPITYRYEFTFEDKPDDQAKKVFTLSLHPKTMNLIYEEKDSYPSWTELTHCQCPNCPLKPAEHRYCPIAANLVDLIDFFKSSISYERVHMKIESEARIYIKDTSLQEGVSAILGVIMPTSGCPIMGKLKPMVRTHLPFGNHKETTFRLLSMYLLAQYFIYKRGDEPDWDLNGLKKVFKDIELVNKHFWSRFASVKIEDASLNALVHLNNLAQYVAFSVDENLLSETELLFNDYFEEKDEA